MYSLIISIASVTLKLDKLDIDYVLLSYYAINHNKGDLNFNNPIDLTNQTYFILVENHYIDLPILNFSSIIQLNNNSITIINLYNVNNNTIINDTIIDQFRFNVANFNFTSIMEVL